MLNSHFKIKLITALVMASGAMHASASLGALDVRSNLGEPFSATLTVSGPTAQELNRGAAASVNGAPLRASVIRKSGDTAVIQLRSTTPINEPILVFSVKAGTETRKYTALLDPRSGNDAGKAAAAAPKTTTTVAPAQASTSTAQAASAGGNRYTVKAGESIYDVARRHQPEGLSLAQTVRALVNANPRAFRAGNPDLLYSGATLSVPSAEQMRSLARGGVRAPVKTAPAAKAAAPSAAAAATTSATPPAATAPANVATTASAPTVTESASAPVNAAASAVSADQVAQLKADLARAEAEKAQLQQQLAAKKQAEVAQAAANAQQQEAEDGLGSLVQYLPYLGLGALALLLGYLFWRKRQGEAEVEDVPPTTELSFPVSQSFDSAPVEDDDLIITSQVSPQEWSQQSWSPSLETELPEQTIASAAAIAPAPAPSRLPETAAVVATTAAAAVAAKAVHKGAATANFHEEVVAEIDLRQGEFGPAAATSVAQKLPQKTQAADSAFDDDLRFDLDLDEPVSKTAVAVDKPRQSEWVLNAEDLDLDLAKAPASAPKAVLAAAPAALPAGAAAKDDFAFDDDFNFDVNTEAPVAAAVTAPTVVPAATEAAADFNWEASPKEPAAEAAKPSAWHQIKPVDDGLAFDPDLSFNLDDLNPAATVATVAAGASVAAAIPAATVGQVALDKEHFDFEAPIEPQAAPEVPGWTQTMVAANNAAPELAATAPAPVTAAPLQAAGATTAAEFDLVNLEHETLEFTTPDLNQTMPAEAAPSSVPAAAVDDDLDALSFDTEWAAPAPAAAAVVSTAAAAPEPAPVVDDALSFDLDEPFASVAQAAVPAGGANADAPNEAKLELAKMYLEMGDREAARETLEDLLEDADGLYYDKAQALLAQVSA